ncbi:MAG: PQQ-dependent sugar dehydrogenase [Ginsengibacter sp.]
MKIKIPVGLFGLLFLFCFYSCNSGNNSNETSTKVDEATIAKGQTLFTQNCSGCHGFRQDGIGPRLDGITSDTTTSWIRNFIKDPQQVIESGDARAQELHKRYPVIMPSFAHLPDEDINAIIAFLGTKKGQAKDTLVDKNAIKNPIPDSIPLSNLVVNLKEIAQFPPSSEGGKLPLTRITQLGNQPGNSDLFILDLRGELYKLENNKPVVYMDMAALKPKFVNVPGLATGFGSFAFHPDFAKNGLLYTTHTEVAGSAKADFSYPDSIETTVQWVVTEWKTDHPGQVPFSGKGRELFRINMVQGIHGIQQIAFNPFSKPGDKDYGLLYICIGDGGSVEEGYPFLAHNKERPWGTILRIDPLGRNSRNGKYGIPSDNPFVNDPDPKVLKEIYAYGFRNPHRISWTKSGQMIACNIGFSNIEAVDFIKPGHDYGWPIREGNFLLKPHGDLNHVYPLPPDDSSYHITYPVAEYDHDEGNAICGGFEYHGNKVPQLKGKFLFGDIPTGHLFYTNVDDMKQGKLATIKKWRVAFNGEIKTLRQLCGTNRVDLHFGQDANGELYILTKPDGKLYQLESVVKE